MARKQRNDVDYFPHMVSHGKKMHYIREEYGNDGYAVWFMILEKLGSADHHFLDLNNRIESKYLCSQFKVTQEVLESIIEDLVEFGEFDKQLWENDRIIFCKKFMEEIEDAYIKRSSDCIMDANEMVRHLNSIGRDTVTKFKKSIQSVAETNQSESDSIENTLNKGESVGINSQIRKEETIEDKKREDQRREDLKFFVFLSHEIEQSIGKKIKQNFDWVELRDKAKLSISHVTKQYGINDPSDHFAVVTIIEVIKNSKFYKEKGYVSMHKITEYWDSNFSSYKKRFQKLMKKKYDTPQPQTK